MALIWTIEEVDCRLAATIAYLEAIYGIVGYASSISSSLPYQTRLREVAYFDVCGALWGGFEYDAWRFSVRAAGQVWLLAYHQRDSSIALPIRSTPDIPAPGIMNAKPWVKYFITLPAIKDPTLGSAGRGYVALPDIQKLWQRYRGDTPLCCWYRKLEPLRQQRL